ncbi:MAG: class I adenylate-forming enzyme family protein [Chthoniobacterales bacterium]
MLNIAAEIFARSNPDAPALVVADRTLSFGELQSLTVAASKALGEVGRGRVGLYCPNGIAHIVWSLAVLHTGGVLVPIAPELSSWEREQVLQLTGLNAVLCAEGKFWGASLPLTTTLEVPGLGNATFLSGRDLPETEFDQAKLAALNPALIRFSSGTTGRRKGVVLSHDTLFARVTAANTGLQIGPGDRVIWILPMAHHFAVSIILYLLHGATTVIELSHLGEDVFRALEEKQGTVLYASPFHYALLASYPEAHPVPSLRLAVSTAAALPPPTAAAFRERFGIPLTQALGIIECGLPLLNKRWAATKPLSVGEAQPAYQISLRGEDGAEVLSGEIGELFVRGPGFVDAYLIPWMPRAEILEDGWFRTGDYASRDADGALFLHGRTHSVINIGGMKCFPEEVEAFLNTFPGIRASRVVAQDNPTFGEVPIAEIVPSDPAAPPKIPSLIAFCRERLSNYKRPVKFVFVRELPKTPSGKIQRTK